MEELSEKLAQLATPTKMKCLKRAFETLNNQKKIEFIVPYLQPLLLGYTVSNFQNSLNPNVSLVSSIEQAERVPITSSNLLEGLTLPAEGHDDPEFGKSPRSMNKSQNGTRYPEEIK